MKLGKILYLIAVIIMAVMAYVFLSHNMIIMGGFMTLVSFSAIINYLNIEDQNKEIQSKEHFLNYLDDLEKEQKEFKKKYEHIEYH
jgi:Mg2+/citrate symporter